MARGRRGSVHARPVRKVRRQRARAAPVAKPARKAAARRGGGKKAAGAGKGGKGKPPTLARIVDDLTAERDRLKAELQAALKRLQRLETTQREVTERIDKAISSIHNVLETRN